MNLARVEITGTESDGILIGKVTLENGTDTASELVKAVLAWWDKSKTPNEAGLAQLEKSAREDYLGIWAGVQAEDDDQDFGKEVLAQRDLASGPVPRGRNFILDQFFWL